MKTIRTATAAGAALLLAGMWTPAFASQASSSSNATTPTQAAPQNERRICVREAVTGSRLERTVCRTRAEWVREGGVPGEER